MEVIDDRGSKLPKKKFESKSNKDTACRIDTGRDGGPKDNSALETGTTRNGNILGTVKFANGAKVPA